MPLLVIAMPLLRSVRFLLRSESEGTAELLGDCIGSHCYLSIFGAGKGVVLGLVQKGRAFGETSGQGRTKRGLIKSLEIHH